MPPQVHQETLLTGGCGEEEPPKSDVIKEHDNNFPPESFYLSKDAEYEWFDNNAFFERKESTKGSKNMPRSNSSNSHRYSVGLKSKASIIGLPKSQKATFADSKRRTCKPAVNMSLFPKRSDSTGKSKGVLVEPGSPKVSCMGRVRSKRCRRRSNSLKKRGEKKLEKSQSKGGLYSKVMSMFRSKKGKNKPVRSGSRKWHNHEGSGLKKNVHVTANSEPPALVGMKRFVSGRRSESWTGEDFN